jgi:archaellum biogenesis ATPase FlaH
MEKRLISAALKSRKAFDEIFSKVDPDKFSAQGAFIGKAIKEYYELDNDAKSIDVAVVKNRVGESVRNDKHVAAIHDYLDSLDPEVSIPNLAHDIKLFQQLRLGDELSLALVNREEPNKIRELMAQYEDLSHSKEEKSEEEIFHKKSVKQLLEKSFDPTRQIKLSPRELNDRCDGGARPGHHILVYARPEIGKTLFAQNLCAGFLRQGYRTLYIGNEDPASDILLRFICRLSKMTKAQVRENPDEAERRSFANGYDNLVVASLAPGNFFEIRKLVEKHKPAVVVLDQLRNLEVNSESRVLALEKAATEARNLAKRHSLLVVSVTQAGDSAEGKAILGRDDIDFSKTGIPAQVDLMIGIGADPTMEQHGIRTISLPKNKLSGRHDHFVVTINPAIGTVQGA